MHVLKDIKQILANARKAMQAAFALNVARHKLKSGERLVIKPLTIKQMWTISMVFEPVAEAMAEHGMRDIDVYAAHADELVKVVATATGKEIEEIEGWDWGDFERVLQKLLATNRDFFEELVKRGVRQMASKALMQGLKPTGS